MVKVTGVPNPGRTVSVLIRGSNELVVGEADRSLHDALCVVRSLVKRRFLLAGGGAPEMEIMIQLSAYAATLSGMASYCVKAYADALEVNKGDGQGARQCPQYAWRSCCATYRWSLNICGVVKYMFGCPFENQAQFLLEHDAHAGVL